MRAKPQSPLPRNPVPAWSPPTTTTDPMLEKDAAGGDFPANLVLQLMPLKTFPAAIRGVIQSELNYSVILQWVVTMDPEPVLSWTFSGVPCGMGEKLFIRRLSCEQLGTYMCIATNSKKQLVSEPVTISLPKPIMQPTEAEPMEPDPTLSLSGGSAIGLLAAGILGAGALIAGMCFIIIQSLRTDRQRIGICS
ncbi:immunoglobulin superfamily member 23 [Homo sapiens]|uniref:Immunoglobulin superfamily member 23 n=1 Tax=Homo sapiens TaxID=9606 RepID=IGS23_HUMAN|nr:immunoglobulin superfamily member 23 [Homo sapiens]A1L1A6.2 RecName: Full=Immunoglobulin superfamily member 23 [Homo sapiens]EAW57282.1 hCG1996180, isoform CRA_b [Homo sapiens]KAI2591605.1 immunoglobulin superfamily member 23 [Homo sapiens]KAI4043264.1 immunoglobulin superfamily member 23 [Homo sapiens]|eukprot:NP_001192209.1 immunoglobulin superfamily member 23 [Homo sapiens]